MIYLLPDQPVALCDSVGGRKKLTKICSSRNGGMLGARHVIRDVAMHFEQVNTRSSSRVVDEQCL